MKPKLLIIMSFIVFLFTAGCSGGTSTETDTAVISLPATEAQTSFTSTEPVPDMESESGPEPVAISDNTRPVNVYSLCVTLNDSEHKLTVTQNLIYYNNTGTILSEIYFNLIPEAFKKDGGGTQMGDILVAGEKCEMTQVQSTVYKLALPTDLAINEKLEIQMEYDVSIPNIQNRFGYQDKVFNLGNFIVTPAMYGADGWMQQPYVDLGDAFFTDIGDYDVKIIVPEGYIVAATGQELEVGSGLYHAENVRDFAFCTSPSYEMISETYDGVSIVVYYNDGISQTAERVMDSAKKSLDLCGEKFGKYPYNTLSLVMNGLTGGVNGMEYPTLVMLSPDPPLEHLIDFGVDLFNSEEAAPHILQIDSAVCHEIAHQWFYNIVGNDQITEPWIDEGLCRYTEYLYQKAYPPTSVHESTYPLVDRLRDRYAALSGISAKADMTYAPDTTDLNQSLYDWAKDDPMGYGEIYDKGASLIYQMEQQMGGEAFDMAIKEYVDRFAFGTVSTEDFVNFWSEKDDFSELFSLYLNR